MKSTNKLVNFIKRFILTMIFPVLVFILMFIITRANGVSYYGFNVDMWRVVLVNTCSTAVAALAIWLQVKNGRFDFSGGAVMVLSAIIAGNISVQNNGNALMFLILCIVIAVFLSVITSLIYIYGRLPIMICTIGVALLYESVTYLVYDATGLSIISLDEIPKFGHMPYILIVLAIAVIVFCVYSYLTVEGKRSKALSNNQQASVNIGIKENKNVIITFVICGILLGCAACIYGSNNKVMAQAGLETASTLFSNIIPAYMGMFVGMASTDAIGVVVAALAMELLNYGLVCIGYGDGGWQQIIVGTFMLLFYSFTAQWPRIKEARAKKQRISVAK